MYHVWIYKIIKVKKKQKALIDVGKLNKISVLIVNHIRYINIHTTHKCVGSPFFHL